MVPLATVTVILARGPMPVAPLTGSMVTFGPGGLGLGFGFGLVVGADDGGVLEAAVVSAELDAGAEVPDLAGFCESGVLLHPAARLAAIAATAMRTATRGRRTLPASLLVVRLVTTSSLRRRRCVVIAARTVPGAASE